MFCFQNRAVLTQFILFQLHITFWYLKIVWEILEDTKPS